MEDEWVLEDRCRDLSNLCDDLWTVETIPIYRIKDVCEDYGIDCGRFVKAWNELMDLSHEIVNKAEEMMI